MAVGAYCLTTLALLKEFLGVTTSTDDTLMEHLLDRATAKIETYCGRLFVSRDYREWVDPRRAEVLTLKNRPVTAVKRVACGDLLAMTVSSATSTDIRCTVEVQDDKLILSRFDSAGVETATSLAFSTYPTTTLLAAQVNLTSGWSAALVTSTVCLDLRRIGGMEAKRQSAQLTYPDSLGSATIIDESRGQIRLSGDCYWEECPQARFPSGMQNTLVQYTGGYSTVPDDLQQVCIELAAQMFYSRRRDTTLQSETLGDYSYTMSDSSTNSTLTDDMRDRLGDYREVR